MSNLELKKGKSIRYEDYQIDVFDNEGKINLVIKRGGLSFVFNSKMEYSEKFNYVAESNSLTKLPMSNLESNQLISFLTNVIIYFNTTNLQQISQTHNSLIVKIC